MSDLLILSLCFGQVAVVMRQELTRLKKCFGGVTSRLDEMNDVPAGEALPSAKAMDDKIQS